MHRGKYGADRLARSLSALLAHYRLERRSLYLWVFTSPKAFDAYPMHRPPIHRVFLANVRNIVLESASRDAGLASRTKVLIDDHPPLGFEFLKSYFHEHALHLVFCKIGLFSENIPWTDHLKCFHVIYIANSQMKSKFKLRS
jgi:hypothetical protein